MSVLRFDQFVSKDLYEAKKDMMDDSEKTEKEEKKEESDKEEIKVSDKKIRVTLNVQLNGARVNRIQELFPKVKMSGVGVEQDEAVLKCDDDDLIDTLKILKKECKVKEIMITF